MEIIIGTNTNWIIQQMQPKQLEGSKFIHQKPKPKKNIK
jgi:hypothetical protein